MKTVIRLNAIESLTIRFDSQAVEGKPGVLNKIFPIGVTRYRRDFPGGKIEMTAAFLQSFIRNWERMGKAALPVDYWHDDDSPSSIASGWIEGLELRADGLYALIKWTASAKAKIDADELRFLSPSFALDMQDPTTGKSQGPTLLGAALLNKPFLFDLPRVAASRDPSPTPIKETTMLRTLLLTLFALPEVTTDDVIAARVRALADENTKLGKEMTEKIELTSKPIKVELAAAKDQVTKLEADVVKLKDEKRDVEIATFLTKLETEKKLLPANRDSAKEICVKMGMEFATKHFAAAVAIVPVGEKGFKGSGGETMSAEQANQAIDAEISRLQKENPGMTVREARKSLSATKPELIKMAAAASGAGAEA